MAAEKIPAYLASGIVSSNSAEAHSLYKKSSFGEPAETKDKIQYTLTEAIYLIEKGKLEIFSGSGKKPLTKEELLNKLKRIDKKILVKYVVFKDLRERGYIVKTAFKFGAEFRVYDKGIKPGQKGKHAKWIVFTEQESSKFSWHEFSAKNRVAHSTNKNLLLAIVDEESDITYYEIKWIKP